MTRLAALLLLSWCALFGQAHPLQELIEAAHTNSPRLKDLLAAGLPALHGRDGAAVWGQDFLFAVEAEQSATLSMDHQPPLPMTNVPGVILDFSFLAVFAGALRTGRLRVFIIGTDLFWADRTFQSATLLT